MSNVIEFLERLGRDSKLRNAADSDINQALTDAGIDSAIGQAIRTGNQTQLEEVLQAKTNVCAMIFPSQEDERDTDTQAVSRMSQAV